VHAPQAILTGNGDQRRALIVVFLRGAADGLSLVAPVEDDAYFAARRAWPSRKRMPSRSTDFLE